MHQKGEKGEHESVERKSRASLTHTRREFFFSLPGARASRARSPPRFTDPLTPSAPVPRGPATHAPIPMACPPVVTLRALPRAPRLTLGCHVLDGLLRGGVLTGGITEVVGE